MVLLLDLVNDFFRSKNAPYLKITLESDLLVPGTVEEKQTTLVVVLVLLYATSTLFLVIEVMCT